jgi:hypothetical protein
MRTSRCVQLIAVSTVAFSGSGSTPADVTTLALEVLPSPAAGWGRPAYCIAYQDDGVALFVGISATVVHGEYTGRHDGRALSNWLRLLDDSGFSRLPENRTGPIDGAPTTFALRRAGHVKVVRIWDEAEEPDWLSNLKFAIRREAEKVRWRPATFDQSECRLSWLPGANVPPNEVMERSGAELVSAW